jgi:hypothetical protein
MIRSVVRRFSSWPAIGRKRSSGGLMTQEVGFHAAPTMGRRGAALGRMPRRDSAEAVQRGNGGEERGHLDGGEACGLGTGDVIVFGLSVIMDKIHT